MQLTSVYMHAGIVSGPDEPSRAARDFRRRDVANATDLELDHGDSSRLQRGMLGGRCGGGGKCGAGTGQRGGGEREMSAGCSAELHWARRWCGAAAARAASGLGAGFVLPMAAVWRAALGALPWPEIPVHAPLRPSAGASSPSVSPASSAFSLVLCTRPPKVAPKSETKLCFCLPPLSMSLQFTLPALLPR